MMNKQNVLKLFLAMCGVVGLLGYGQAEAMQSGGGNPFATMSSVEREYIKKVVPCCLLRLPSSETIDHIFKNVSGATLDQAQEVLNYLHDLGVVQSTLLYNFGSTAENIRQLLNGNVDQHEIAQTHFTEQTTRFCNDVKNFDALLRKLNPQVGVSFEQNLQSLTAAVGEEVNSGKYGEILTAFAKRDRSKNKIDDSILPGQYKQQWDEGQLLGSLGQKSKTMEPSKQRPDVNSSQLPNSTNPTSSSSAQKKVLPTAPQPGTTPDLDGDNNDSITPPKSSSTDKQPPAVDNNGLGSANANSSSDDNQNNKTGDNNNQKNGENNGDVSDSSTSEVPPETNSETPSDTDHNAQSVSDNTDSSTSSESGNSKSSDNKKLFKVLKIGGGILGVTAVVVGTGLVVAKLVYDMSPMDLLRAIKNKITGSAYNDDE